MSSDSEKEDEEENKSEEGGTHEEVEGGEEAPKNLCHGLFAEKRHLLPKISNTALAKKLFKKFVSKETILLLETIQELTLQIDGAEKAKQIESELVKLAMKVLLLYDSKVDIGRIF